MVQGLLDKLDEFVGDAPQYDDVTVLALRWHKAGKLEEA